MANEQTLFWMYLSEHCLSLCGVLVSFSSVAVVLIGD